MEDTTENQVRLQKKEDKDIHGIMNKKIEIKEKSWGSKSKTQMSRTDIMMKEM